MTVTSKLHAQAERTKKQKREDKAASSGGSDKDPNRKMVLRHGGAPLVTKRTALADDLSAQGSGLRARQTKGSPHAPEIPTPTPAVNHRFDIDCLAHGLEGNDQERVVFLSARMKSSRSSSP